MPINRNLDDIDVAISKTTDKLHALRNERRFRRELGDRLMNTILARAAKPEGICSEFPVLAEGRTWYVTVQEARS